MVSYCLASASAGAGAWKVTNSECRRCSSKTALIRPRDSSLVRLSRRSIPSSQVFGTMKKICVIVFASTSSLPGLKQQMELKRSRNGKEDDSSISSISAKDGPEPQNRSTSTSKSRGEVRISAGQKEKQAGKATQGTTTPPSPSSKGLETSTAPQVRKDLGFAGLSALKAQLEKQQERKTSTWLSRVDVNDIVGARQQHTRSQFKPSPKSEAHKEIGSGKLRLEARESGTHGQTKFTILVRNLAKETTQEEYQSAMESISEITGWEYLSDSDGLCRGYSKCAVQAEEDVAVAIRALSKQVLHGRRIEAFQTESTDEPVQSRLQSEGTTFKDRNSNTRTSRKDRNLNGREQHQAEQIDASTVPSSFTKRDAVREIWHGSGKAEGKQSKWNQNSKTEPGDGASKGPPSSWGRGMADVQTSSSEESSPIVYETADDGRPSGRSVMEALQRATSLQGRTSTKPRKKKGRSTTRKFTGDSDGEDEQRSSRQDPLPPLVFKAEWASKIEELETELQSLRRLL